jgi:hypothetical protein
MSITTNEPNMLTLKNTRALAAALTLIAAPTQTIAAEGDLWLDINGLSYHAADIRQYCKDDLCRPFNKVNKGLGISYGTHDNIELKTGFYENSYHANTVYAGAHLHTKPQRGVEVGLNLGLASGYHEERLATKSGIVPIGALTLGFQRSGLRTVVSYAPLRTVFGGKADVYTIQLGISLNKLK